MNVAGLDRGCEASGSKKTLSSDVSKHDHSSKGRPLVAQEPYAARFLTDRKFVAIALAAVILCASFLLLIAASAGLGVLVVAAIEFLVFALLGWRLGRRHRFRAMPDTFPVSWVGGETRRNAGGGRHTP